MVSCLNPGTVGGGLAYDEFVALVRRHGFAAVEFGIEWLEQKSASEGEDVVRQWLAKQGIQHVAFGLSVAWSGEESKYRESLQTLPAKAKTAQVVGCVSCVTYVPPSIEVGFLKALKTAGYDGAVSFEVLSRTLPQQFLKEELAAKAKAGLDKILAQV